MYYWTTNRHFKVETALLQFLSNLSNSFTGLTVRILQVNLEMMEIIY